MLTEFQINVIEDSEMIFWEDLVLIDNFRNDIIESASFRRELLKQKEGNIGIKGNLIAFTIIIITNMHNRAATGSLMKDRKPQNSYEFTHRIQPGNINNPVQNQISQSESTTKFYIRYEQTQANPTKSKARLSKRYSFKQQPKPKLKLIDPIGEMKSAQKKSRIPSYLRPTQSSAQMEKLRAASNAQIESQKSSMLSKIRSKSLEREEGEPQKQYNRVPIEYYDEKDGKGGDSIRGRIVYRGYMPKNTHFFLKSLKPLVRTKKITKNPQTLNIPQNMRNQHELKFDSRFQSGNLATVVRITSNQYCLFMREDTNTHGLRQWYYFLVVTRKPIKAKFKIYKFSKYYSLYRYGMKPYVRMCNSQNNFIPSEWHQAGQNIKYQYDSQMRCFYLEFSYQFEEEGENIQFAMLPPYTYSMMKNFLLELASPSENLSHIDEDQENNDQQDLVLKKRENFEQFPKIIQKNGYRMKLEIAGFSLAGLEMPLIEIKQHAKKKTRDTHRKQAIVVLARTHPGQTVSNFSLENFVKRVLELPSLLQKFDFYIIPMVNPDGVFIGNHRTSAIGQDLNRNFNSKDLQVFPQIQTIHNLISKIRKSQKIHYILDLHGHSARRNIFAYADEHQIGSKAYLHSRILPKLLSQEISSFKYDFCVFRQSKQKKNTARVYFTKKYAINCITFQQSYGLLDVGKIRVENWRNFGTALANALNEYCRIYFDGQYENSLSEYLEEEMQREKESLAQRILKQKRMLGLLTDDKQEKNPENQPPQQKQKCQISTKIQKKPEILIEKQEFHNNSSISINIQEINLQNKNKDDANLDYSRDEKENLVEEEEQNQCENHNEDNSSVKSSELSSGDQQLELKNEELQVIKKQVVKVGCLKEALKRQKYNIADAKLDLFESPRSIHQNPLIDYEGNFVYSNSYHSSKIIQYKQYKSQAIPRMAKLQSRKKQQYNSILRRFDQEKQKQLLSILQRQRQRDERRMSIEQKFQRKVELPSINSTSKK